MKIIFRVIIIAALAALGVWLWTVLFPSAEKVIHKRLVELARTTSASPDESDLVKVAAARSVAGFFSTNVEMAMDLPEMGRRKTMDREEITQAVLLARSRSGGMQVGFSDMAITVAPDKQSAVANLTVQANVSGARDQFVQQMKFTLRKIDGQWLITRVETVRSLS